MIHGGGRERRSSGWGEGRQANTGPAENGARDPEASTAFVQRVHKAGLLSALGAKPDTDPLMPLCSSPSKARPQSA